MNETSDNLNHSIIPQPQPQSACPHCGYCPHCGRANTLPYYAQPDRWYETIPAIVWQTPYSPHAPGIIR